MSGNDHPAVRILEPGDEEVLRQVADGVFDDSVLPEFASEFLSDSRHHLAVAIVDEWVVGMASAVDYVHPDKPRELWINEVGVAPPYQGAGLGTALLEALFERGRSRGCEQAWVLTSRSNEAARRLYARVGGVEEHDTLMVSFTLPASQRS